MFFSNTCFAAAFLFRNATTMRYRQLQGLAETIVGRENAPTYSAFQKRMTGLGCTFEQKGSGNTAAAWFSDGSAKTEISLFAFDATGLKPTNRGDWMTEKWGTRRGFIKLHVGVDARTKKIYAVAITDDKCGDSPQFEKFNRVKHEFLLRMADPNDGMVPRIDNDQFVSALLDGRVTGDKISK